MHLLALVAGSNTDSDLFDSFIKFAEQTLGKGVVIAKDTPNFIANRIGAFDMSHAMHLAIKMGLKVEEVDAIAGPALGRPKSAVFRLIDLVGVEDAEHYQAGRDTLVTFLNNESLGYVWDLRSILDEIKPTIYSKPLIAFDAKTSGYRKGELSLFHYCRFLNLT